MNEIILAPCHVISKIKQNSSDMNEIILAPCDVMSLAKLNKILVISMKLYWHPAMSLAKLNKILVISMKLYWHPAMQVMYKVVLVLNGFLKSPRHPWPRASAPPPQKKTPHIHTVSHNA
jgi:hypothetical protein